MSEKKSQRTIGHVEIERELGQGGMGVVHLGQQPALDRRVVVKTLRRALADDPALVERFLREARSAAAVQHQNVVAVYDCFTWRGEHYMVQEYVDGVDVATAIAARTRVAPRIAGLVALELARGLEEIHVLGIVHRDLKPSNILLSHAGATKIADFGIALGDDGPGLTQTGHAVGTPLYMSPEQLLGERADARSDLFSLGILMYEMLTGRVPFTEGEGEAGGSLVRRMQSGRYPRLRRLAPETPRALARLVTRCLRSKPGKRPASAAALREGLERVAGATPPGACRAEIAAWLWERGVFQPREDGTVAVLRPIPRRPFWRGSLRWAAAVVICGLCAASALLVGRMAPPAWIPPVLANLVAVEKLTAEPTDVWPVTQPEVQPVTSPETQSVTQPEGAVGPRGAELEQR
jgi:serine/threonine protein kinase